MPQDTSNIMIIRQIWIFYELEKTIFLIKKKMNLNVTVSQKQVLRDLPPQHTEKVHHPNPSSMDHPPS